MDSAEELISHLFGAAQAGKTIARGHADAMWSLLPSVWRPGTIPGRLKKALEIEDWHVFLGAESKKHAAQKYLGETNKQSIARVRYLAAQLRTEISLVKRFCAECDRAALPVPGHTAADMRIEIAEHHGEFGEGSDLITPYAHLGSAFAFAQHYLIPTRLLDFTDNPLKAAYFAVAGKPIAKHFAIWIVRENATTGESSAYFDDTQVLRALRSQIPFLHAQDGLFLSCNISSNRYFLQTGSWPTIEKVLSGFIIEKVVSPGSIAKDVRKRLNRLGISDTTMKPSYESVSTYLRSGYIT